MFSILGHVINSPCCYDIWEVTVELYNLQIYFAECDTPRVQCQKARYLVLPFRNISRVTRSSLYRQENVSP
jgi:hypothetical protein